MKMLLIGLFSLIGVTLTITAAACFLLKEVEGGRILTIAAGVLFLIALILVQTTKYAFY